MYLEHAETGKLVAVVAIGALLVGSVVWTGGAQPGRVLKRGDELGCVILFYCSVLLIYVLLLKLFCVWREHDSHGVS